MKKKKRIRGQGKLYVCGRCGHKAHHKIACHSCRIMMEMECPRCHNAVGNCICRLGAISAKNKGKKLQDV